MPLFLKPGVDLTFDYEWYADQIYQELLKQPTNLEKGQKFNPKFLDESKPNIFFSPERCQVVLIWNKLADLDRYPFEFMGSYSKAPILFKALEKYSTYFKYIGPRLSVYIYSSLEEFTQSTNGTPVI